MRAWGDSVARGFLGVLAVCLIVTAVASWWHGHRAIAVPLLALGAVLAVMCAFFRGISGELEYSALKLRFAGPKRDGKGRRR